MSKWLILALTLAALGCGSSAYLTDVEDCPGKINLAMIKWGCAAVFTGLDVLVILSALFWKW